MSAKLKIDLHATVELNRFLENCVFSDAKTTDGVKEYFLAKHTQSVQYKLQKMLLRNKNTIHQSLKQKSIDLNELEVLALLTYFQRYEGHPFLQVVKWNIEELMRIKFPDLILVLTNKPLLNQA